MTSHPNQPSIDVVLLAMFVWQGFMEAAPWSKADSDRYGGQIGAAGDLLVAVRVLHQTLTEYLAADPETDFPGVLDYEVSEPLGAWHRLNGHAGLDALRGQARRLVREFFEPTRCASPCSVKVVRDEHHAAVQTLRTAGFVVVAPPIAHQAADAPASEPPVAWRLGP